jgi:two-component system sensor histidine kinase KdpD
VVTFAVMLVVALVISTLTVQTRHQAESARQRERRTAALYAMSRELASTRGVDELLRIAVRHVGEVFGSEVAVSLPDATGRLVTRAGSLGSADSDPSERAVGQWVHERGQMAGLGSATLPGARALYLPLAGSRGTVGVLGIRPVEPQSLEAPEQLHLLETFAAQTALAVERGMLGEEAARAQLRIEAERLRNSLLSSVSHDLRTPLATITGAASGLLEGGDRLEPAARQELLEAIHEEADRLNRLVNNLLDMTRLESGAIQVRKEWHSLEELVGSALTRLGRRLGEHPVTTRLPPDLPLVPLDGVLVEQVLINLLDNAVKHTPAGTPIEIAAAAGHGEAQIEVADRGPGLPPGDEGRVFDKFYRGTPARTGPGVGLGLTICRGIVEAHGGRITAESRPGGGVAFRVALPLADKPPEIPPADG